MSSSIPAGRTGIGSVSSNLTGQTEMHSNLHLGSDASGLEKSIVPDSLENDQLDNPIVNKAPLSSDIAEPVECNLGRGKFSPSSEGLPFGADDIYKPSSHHNETHGGGEMSHLEELQNASTEGTPDNNLLVFYSDLVCRSPDQKIQITRSKNSCLNSDDGPGPDPLIPNLSKKRMVLAMIVLK
ncbi:hypothetical protein Ancab_004387, partial [Ancistrocladus abbreviatus]